MYPCCEALRADAVRIFHARQARGIHQARCAQGLHAFHLARVIQGEMDAGGLLKGSDSYDLVTLHNVVPLFRWLETIVSVTGLMIDRSICFCR